MWSLAASPRSSWCGVAGGKMQGCRRKGVCVAMVMGQSHGNGHLSKRVSKHFGKQEGVRAVPRPRVATSMSAWW